MPSGCALLGPDDGDSSLHHVAAPGRILQKGLYLSREPARGLDHLHRAALAKEIGHELEVRVFRSHEDGFTQRDRLDHVRPPLVAECAPDEYDVGEAVRSAQLPN